MRTAVPISPVIPNSLKPREKPGLKILVVSPEITAELIKDGDKKGTVSTAWVRIGTKRFRAKDRGKAYEIRKMASHIHVTVAEM